eukprot:g11020.t1
MKDIPKEYLCPISQEILVDPVIADDGHTYEKTAIARWFSSGNLRSPITNQYLKTDKLIPNKTLRNLINTYKSELGKKFIENCGVLSLDEMSEYIDAGADINTRSSKNGDSILMVLIRCNRVDLIRKFLKHNPDVLCKNDDGDTAITLAQSVNPSSGVADKLMQLASTQKVASNEKSKERDRKRQQFQREQQETRRNQQGSSNGMFSNGGFQFGFFPFPFVGFSWSNMNSTNTSSNQYSNGSPGFSVPPAPMRPSQHELDVRNQVFFSRCMLAIGIVFMLMLNFMPLPDSMS